MNPDRAPDGNGPSLGKQLASYTYPALFRQLTSPRSGGARITAPMIIEPAPDRPGTEAPLLKLAQLLDLPIQITQEQLGSILECVNALTPYVEDIRARPRRVYERRYEVNFEGVNYIFEFRLHHSLADKSALRDVSLRLQAVELCTNEPLSDQALDKLRQVTLKNTASFPRGSPERDTCIWGRDEREPSLVLRINGARSLTITKELMENREICFSAPGADGFSTHAWWRFGGDQRIREVFENTRNAMLKTIARVKEHGPYSPQGMQLTDFERVLEDHIAYYDSLEASPLYLWSNHICDTSGMSNHNGPWVCKNGFQLLTNEDISHHHYFNDSGILVCYDPNDRKRLKTKPAYNVNVRCEGENVKISNHASECFYLVIPVLTP